MFCKNCGNQVKDGATFCPKCGNAIKPVETNPLEPQERLVPMQKSAPMIQNPPVQVPETLPQKTKTLRGRAWFAPVSTVLSGISFIVMIMLTPIFTQNLDMKENIAVYNAKINEINGLMNLAGVGIAVILCLLMYFIASFGIPSKVKKQIFPYAFASYALGIFPLSISSALNYVMLANFEIEQNYISIIYLCLAIAFVILFTWISYMVAARGLGAIEIPVFEKNKK